MWQNRPNRHSIVIVLFASTFFFVSSGLLAAICSAVDCLTSTYSKQVKFCAFDSVLHCTLFSAITLTLIRLPEQFHNSGKYLLHVQLAPENPDKEKFGSICNFAIVASIACCFVPLMIANPKIKIKIILAPDSRRSFSCSSTALNLRFHLNICG